MDAPVKPREEDAATAVSERASSEALSSMWRVRAGERGDDAGLSEPRYVVAKMLSRSDSCGRSTKDVHRCSMASGAVLERPVCERLLGGSSARGGTEGWAPPWPGACGAFDLTNAGGDGRLGAGEGCDMESTLVKPRKGTFGCAWVSVWQILPEGSRTRSLGGCAVALRETAAPAAAAAAAAPGMALTVAVAVAGVRVRVLAIGGRYRGSQSADCWSQWCVHVPIFCGQGLSAVAPILHKRASAMTSCFHRRCASATEQLSLVRACSGAGSVLRGANGPRRAQLLPLLPVSLIPSRAKRRLQAWLWKRRHPWNGLPVDRWVVPSADVSLGWRDPHGAPSITLHRQPKTAVLPAPPPRTHRQVLLNVINYRDSLACTGTTHSHDYTFLVRSASS